MSDSDNPQGDTSASDLAHLQALKYGQDLARIYVAERAKREELEVAYQALNAIFTSTPDGLIVLDDEFRILQANVAFGNLVETAPDATKGRPISEVVFSDDLVPTLLKLSVDEGAPTQVELTVTRPVKRSLLANIARLQSGRLRGWIVVFHDQSNRKRVEYQKIEFINIAAHELRTPLSAVLGYGELLQEQLAAKSAVLGEDAQSFLEAVLRGAQRLSGVIEELVQFAAVNQGDLRSHDLQNFTLSTLIDDVLADLQQYARDKRVKLRMEVPDSSLSLYADPALVRSALHHLALNGINFNKLGGNVSVEATKNAEFVTIVVSDSGIGISQYDLESIYRPFFQSEGHDTRHVGGLGLGLSIVHRAVTQLGGKITVDSTLGKGTAFKLELPLQQAVSEVVHLKQQLDSTHQQSLAYARDIQMLYRQLQQVNKGLLTVNTQLEEVNKLKSNFLGVISHELRSPFASIDFALQTFSRYGVDNLVPAQRELLDQLVRDFNNARRMIEHLVDYATLLSKQGNLILAPVDLNTVMENTVMSLRPIAERRSLDIQVEVPPHLVLPRGDSERIGEAIWHLLHNAIKFTPASGQIIVRARQEPDFVAIEVKDTGPGVPVEKQTTIWEPFAQLSDSLKRGVEGLGVGLALVRYVAVAHGGNVILHSEPGVGSVFGFWLPVSTQLDELQSRQN